MCNKYLQGREKERGKGKGRKRTKEGRVEEAEKEEMGREGREEEKRRIILTSKPDFYSTCRRLALWASQDTSKHKIT